MELARDDVAAASVSIQRALAEGGQPFQRPRLLDATVEIHLAGGDVASARTAADALGDRSSVELELDGARETFESLGALPRPRATPTNSRPADLPPCPDAHPLEAVFHPDHVGEHGDVPGRCEARDRICGYLSTEGGQVGRRHPLDVAEVDTVLGP